MSHTPGPWSVTDDPPRTYLDGEYDAGGFRVDAKDIEQLAFVWRSNKRWGDKSEPFGAVEAEANARLIAAAPDLLAASQAVISAWYSATSSNDVMFDPIIALIALRAAIDKATKVTP